jgi:hypothetical protein
LVDGDPSWDRAMKFLAQLKSPLDVGLFLTGGGVSYLVEENNNLLQQVPATYAAFMAAVALVGAKRIAETSLVAGRRRRDGRKLTEVASAVLQEPLPEKPSGSSLLSFPRRRIDESHQGVVQARVNLASSLARFKMDKTILAREDLIERYTEYRGAIQRFSDFINGQ